MMSASENRRSSRPYDDGPDDAADGRRGRQEPEPDRVHAQPLARVQDEHRHAAPNVTLNVKIVSASVRIGGWATSQRMPSAMSARQAGRLAHLGPGAGDDPRDRAPRRARSRRRSSRTAAPCRRRTGRRRSAGATSWFVSTNAPCIRALAMPRSSRATSPGSSVLLAESAKVSAVPRMNSDDQDDGDADGAADDRADEDDQDDRPDRGPPTMTIRRRSKRSAAAPPSTPKMQHRQVSAQERQRDEERIAASATRRAAGRPRSRCRRRCC